MPTGRFQNYRIEQKYYLYNDVYNDNSAPEYNIGGALLMQIPRQEYTTETFIQYLKENSEKVFEDDTRKKWLKIYCLLISDDTWHKTLFTQNEIEEMGGVFKITPSPKSESDEDVSPDDSNDDRADTDDYSHGTEEIYYAIEYSPGLLLLFTTANDGKYRASLGDRVEKCRGIAPMWIRPNLFKLFWKKNIEENGGFVYRFMSRRRLLDDTPSRLRGEVKRRFNYTGDDGTQTIEELEEMYGVTPESVYIQVSENLKVHLTNDGFFSAQEASSTAITTFLEYLDEIKEPILKTEKISKSLKFDVVSEEVSDLKFASITAGIIKLPNKDIDEYAVNKLRAELEKNFSFIDLHVETGSLSFAATVIDENKSSVFDISGCESEIVIVPKYMVTFESLLKFYRGVTESLDKEAELISSI